MPPRIRQKKITPLISIFFDRGSPQIGPADLAQIFFIEPARGADADCDHGLLRGGRISADRHSNNYLRNRQFTQWRSVIPGLSICADQAAALAGRGHNLRQKARPKK